MADVTFGPSTSILPPLGAPSLANNGKQSPFVPTGWDRGAIGGKLIPGWVKVHDGWVRFKVDDKKKPGADGCNPTFHGMHPQGIKVEIKTFSDADREALLPIIQPYIPRQGTTPQPVNFNHPSLSAIGIYEVQVVGASALMVERPQVAHMFLDLLHYVPTKAANATKTNKSTPLRKTNNVRSGIAPSKQPGVGGPPAGLTKAH